MDDKATNDKKIGTYFLVGWAILIVAGIIGKRVYDHPDYMVFFHLPAAVCLVVGWFHLSRKFRERYRQTLKRFEVNRTSRFS